MDAGGPDGLEAIASQSLRQVLAQGFEQAMVDARTGVSTDLGIEHDRIAVLGTTQTRRATLVGIVAGRRARIDTWDLSHEAIVGAASALWRAAQVAPVDESWFVSSGQRATVEKGPLDADPELLVDRATEWLDWAAANTPTVRIKIGQVSHQLTRSCCLSSEGSEIRCAVGALSAGAAFNAREGPLTSSYGAAGGCSHDFVGRPLQEHFGIDEAMRAAARSLQPRSWASHGLPGVGDVLLAPAAAAPLLEWLLGQLTDERLLTRTSLFRDQVGQQIASPQLSLTHRPGAPGVIPVSADGHIVEPLSVIDQGRLQTLLPSAHGSRKTGLSHRPIASSGWAVAAGDRPWCERLAEIEHGVLVSRLAMGRPAANGDFSGVAKNSFLIRDGRVDGALGETMVSGNIAQVLGSIHALSRERLDTGDWLLPWIHASNVHYS